MTMSRDFTPQMNFWVNKQTNDSFLQNVILKINGIEKPLWTEEEQEIRHKYPLLAVTFCDLFIKLYNSFSENKREIYISKIEDMISKLTTADMNGNIKMADVPEEMRDWYLGKLDTNFYYREYNNELFFNFIKNYIERTDMDNR